jgi:hypothetical protein
VDGRGAFDMVAASEWPGLPEQAVLLSPTQCRTLWRQFSSDSNTAVQQVCASRPLASPHPPSAIDSFHSRTADLQRLEYRWAV